MLNFFSILIVLGISIVNEEFIKEESVTVLTEANLGQALNMVDIAFVMFYKNERGYWKKALAEYEKVAKKYQSDNTILISKFDKAQSEEIINRYQIKHFPTLGVFYKGDYVTVYIGRKREKEMNAYIPEIKKCLMNPIKSMKDLDSIKAEFKTALIYFGDNIDDINTFTSFKSNIMKKTCSDKSIMTKLNITPRSIILFKQFDDKRNDLVIQNTLSLSMIENFVENNCYPVVDILSYEIAIKIFGGKDIGIILFEFSDDEAECLKNEIIFSKAVKEIKDRLKDPEYPTAKKKLISEFKFTKINGKNKGLEKKTFDEMRFPNVEFFPLIQIHNNERKEVLKYDDDFEVPLIVKFIEDFIIKQLIPIDLGDL